MTTPELPPLPHMPRDKAAIVEARERILLARVAELEAEVAGNAEVAALEAGREIGRRAARFVTERFAAGVVGEFIATDELRGILEAITEWKSGCSQGAPGDCRPCVDALVEAIEAKAKRGLAEGGEPKP